MEEGDERERSSAVINMVATYTQTKKTLEGVARVVSARLGICRWAIPFPLRDRSGMCVVDALVWEVLSEPKPSSGIQYQYGLIGSFCFYFG